MKYLLGVLMIKKQCDNNSLQNTVSYSTKVNQDVDFGNDISYDFGHSFELSCNSDNGYVSQGSVPNVECGIEGWNLNDNICQLSRCYGSELTELIPGDIYNYDTIYIYI